MAESLVASSCIVISEWLAVGGPGGDFFSPKACTWCTSAPCENLLLPYCRLAIQLTKHNGNALLLKSIFESYKEELTESSTEIVRNTISCVLTSWAKPETLQSVIDAVLSAALMLLGEFHFDAASETTCCVDMIWPFESGAVKAAIGAILRSIKGSKEVVRQLAGRITITPKDRQEIFLLHFLGMLSRPGSKVRNEAVKAMHDLDIDSLSDQARDMRDEFNDQIENAKR